jgi:hypothetical protein
MNQYRTGSWKVHDVQVHALDRYRLSFRLTRTSTSTSLVAMVGPVAAKNLPLVQDRYMYLELYRSLED